MLHYNLLPPSLFFLPQVCFLFSQLINLKDSYVELDRYEDLCDSKPRTHLQGTTATDKESLRHLKYRIKIKQGHTMKLFMHKKWL